MAGHTKLFVFTLTSQGDWKYFKDPELAFTLILEFCLVIGGANEEQGGIQYPTGKFESSTRRNSGCCMLLFCNHEAETGVGPCQP